MLFFVRKIILGVIFIAVLIGIIAVARGYRFSPGQQTIRSTGILVTSSNPDGAKVLIDDELKGATDTNIVLSPGVYDVRIEKDGFTSWSKELTVKGELITQVDALLFPQNPTLSPVTSLGVNRAINSMSGDKILIVSETDDVEEDGLYMLENVRNPLARINPLKPIVLKSAFNELADFSLTDVDVEFSPDEEEILVTLYPQPLDASDTENPEGAAPESTNTQDENITTPRIPLNIYLLGTGSLAEDPFPVTESVETIRNAWNEERAEIRDKALQTFDEPFAETALSSFDVFAFSPNEEKILYTATQSATLPLVIEPRLIATNQTPEDRDIEPGNIYVYDKEEDMNFKIFDEDAFTSMDDARQRLQWYPTSGQIVIQEDEQISVIDYDGTNKRAVYAGPFQGGFYTTSKDGRLFILTNFNTTQAGLYDIYSIGLN